MCRVIDIQEYSQSKLFRFGRIMLSIAALYPTERLEDRRGEVMLSISSLSLMSVYMRAPFPNQSTFPKNLTKGVVVLEGSLNNKVVDWAFV